MERWLIFTLITYFLFIAIYLAYRGEYFGSLLAVTWSLLNIVTLDRADNKRSNNTIRIE